MEEHYDSKHPPWFREWQKKFYKSKKWQQKRKEILLDRKMISDYSGKLIISKAIVDHIIEISPDNYTDENILFGNDNLQLLSFAEHNRKTFGKLDQKESFDLSNRTDSIF